MEKFPTARTFPQITIDGEAIGGYDEFWKWEVSQRVS
jgi:glutaredoxin